MCHVETAAVEPAGSVAAGVVDQIDVVAIHIRGLVHDAASGSDCVDQTC